MATVNDTLVYSDNPSHKPKTRNVKIILHKVGVEIISKSQRKTNQRYYTAAIYLYL